jgi:hypothetical protein
VSRKEQQDLLDRIEGWLPPDAKVTRLSRERLEELHRRFAAGEVTDAEIGDALLACATDVIEHTGEAQ